MLAGDVVKSLHLAANMASTFDTVLLQRLVSVRRTEAYEQIVRTTLTISKIEFWAFILRSRRTLSTLCRSTSSGTGMLHLLDC